MVACTSGLRPMPTNVRHGSQHTALVALCTLLYWLKMDGVAWLTAVPVLLGV